MAQKTNADIIRVVKKWQACPHVHELTCDNDKCRDALVPEERENAVVLVCPSCGLVQHQIPECVLNANEDALVMSGEELREWLKSMNDSIQKFEVCIDPSKIKN